MANIAVGAALEYAQRILGGLVYEVDSSVAVASVAPALQLVGNNPDRVGLIVVNPTINDAFVFPDSAVSSNLGIKLTANGGFMTLNVHDDFTLCARQWFAIMPSGGFNLSVIEIIRISSKAAGSLLGQNLTALQQVGG